LSCKLNSLSEILPILEKCHQSNKPLFIIANDYDQEAIQALLANVSKGLLQICAVRSPFYGEKRNQILNDLAKSLDTKVFYEFDEKVINNILLSDLGTCKKIETTHNETIFVESKNIENSEEISREIEKNLEDKNISKEEEAFTSKDLLLIKELLLYYQLVLIQNQSFWN